MQDLSRGDMTGQALSNTAGIPAVKENVDNLQNECDGLAQAVFETAAIVDRITGENRPSSEAGVPDNPNGLIGDMIAITIRIRAAQTFLREQNARLAELF